jgi:hypothetical protein
VCGARGGRRVDGFAHGAMDVVAGGIVELRLEDADAVVAQLAVAWIGEAVVLAVEGDGHGGAGGVVFG